MCIVVCPLLETPPSELENSGRRAYSYITVFLPDCFNDLFSFELLWVLGYLQTSLLCVVGELAGGGLVALAVGISDREQGT